MSLPCCVCLHQLPQRFRSSAQQNRKPQLDLSSSFLLEWPRCCYVAHSSLPTDIQHTGLQSKDTSGNQLARPAWYSGEKSRTLRPAKAAKGLMGNRDNEFGGCGCFPGGRSIKIRLGSLGSKFYCSQEVRASKRLA